MEYLVRMIYRSRGELMAQWGTVSVSFSITGAYLRSLDSLEMTGVDRDNL